MEETIESLIEDRRALGEDLMRTKTELSRCLEALEWIASVTPSNAIAKRCLDILHPE